MKFTINFPAAGLGLKLNCNNEAAYDSDQLAGLWNCMLMLLSGPSHQPAELAFIEHWLAADFLSEKLKSSLGRKATEVPGSTVEREFSAALRVFRSQLHESSNRATAYKHLCAAAISSERGMERLMPMMSTAREIMELDTTVATLISDGIAAELPNCPHAPAHLSPEERETILAMAMIVLKADEQKHILELTALRIVMLALDITTANNTRLGLITKKGMTGLIDDLCTAALPTALLNIARIVIADHSIHDRERQTLRAIAGKMTASEVQSIRKLVILESGMRFES